MICENVIVLSQATFTSRRYIRRQHKHVPKELPKGVSTAITFRLEYKKVKGSFVGKWSSYDVAISKEFARWISKTFDKLKEGITELSFSQIPDYVDLEMKYDNEFSPEQVDTAFSTVLNSYLKQFSNTAVVISPSSARLFLFNPSWLYDSVSKMKEKNHKFNLTKIKDGLKLPLGGSLLRIAIQESYKHKGLFYDSSFFFEDQ